MADEDDFRFRKDTFRNRNTYFEVHGTTHAKHTFRDEWQKVSHSTGTVSLASHQTPKTKHPLLHRLHLHKWFSDNRPNLEHALFVRLQDINVTVSFNLPPPKRKPRKSQASSTYERKSIFSVMSPLHSLDSSKPPHVDTRKSILSKALDIYQQEEEKAKKIRQAKKKAKRNLNDEVKKLDRLSTSNISVDDIDFESEKRHKSKVQFRLQRGQSLYENMMTYGMLEPNDDTENAENRSSGKDSRNPFGRKKKKDFPKSALKTRTNNTNTSMNSSPPTMSLLSFSWSTSEEKADMERRRSTIDQFDPITFVGSTDIPRLYVSAASSAGSFHSNENRTDKTGPNTVGSAGSSLTPGSKSRDKKASLTEPKGRTQPKERRSSAPERESLNRVQTDSAKSQDSSRQSLRDKGSATLGLKESANESSTGPVKPRHSSSLQDKGNPNTGSATIIQSSESRGPKEGSRNVVSPGLTKTREMTDSVQDRDRSRQLSTGATTPGESRTPTSGKSGPKAGSSGFARLHKNRETVINKDDLNTGSSSFGNDGTSKENEDTNSIPVVKTTSFHSVSSLPPRKSSDNARISKSSNPSFHSPRESRESRGIGSESSFVTARESRGSRDDRGKDSATSFYTPTEATSSTASFHSVEEMQGSIFKKLKGKRQDKDSNQNADTDDEAQPHFTADSRFQSQDPDDNETRRDHHSDSHGRPGHARDSDDTELWWKLRAQMELVNDEIVYLMDENAELQQSLMTARTDLTEKYKQQNERIEKNTSKHPTAEPQNDFSPFRIFIYFLACLFGITMAKLCFP